MMTVSGTGRFVRDPELKAVNETHVCEFSLAVNEFRKVGGERKKFAHFFDCVVWAQAAQAIAKWCHKGDLIEIRATPRQDKWQDSEGRNRSRVVFRVDEFAFLPRSNNSQSNDETESDDVVLDDEGTPF